MQQHPDVQVVHENDHSDEITIKVVIDIEDCYNRQTQPPKHDPGVITHYLIKVDEQRFEVKEHILTGRQILGLVNRATDGFYLEQLCDGSPKTIKPDQVVDLTDFGIERFVSKAKTYSFFIDRKEYESIDKCLSVRQILKDFALVNPEQKTLAQRKESGFHEYKNLDEKICFDEKTSHFTLFDNEACTVS